MSTRQSSAVRDLAPGDEQQDLRPACRDEDPELFFPVGTSGPALAQIAEAKQVCNRCPVKAECLARALNEGIDHGVWGGMSEDARRALKRKTARTRARARDDVEDPQTREVRQFNATGLCDQEIAQQIGVSARKVARIRARAGIPPALPPGRNRRAS